MSKAEDARKSLITSYRYKIYSPFVKAISDYGLVQEGDKIAVCVSGGKDSFTMALCFKELKRRSLVKFDVIYLAMDPGYDNDDRTNLEDNAKKLEIPLIIFENKIFKIASDQEDNRCYLCAKMRRGALYQKAQELGCNKIALAHHKNDVVETTMMSILYDGEVSTMLPLLKSDHFQKMSLIRPLYYVKEDEIISFTKGLELSFIRGGCFILKDESLCETSKRHFIKEALKEMEKDNPTVIDCIFKATDNVNLDKITGYRKERVHHSIKDQNKGDA